MKKRFLVILASILVVLSGIALTACEQEEKEPEYISDSEISSFFNDPDEYKGKYVVLTGKVFNKVESSDGTTTWQAFHDPENSSESFAFATDSTDIATDDYVKVDGEITGNVETTNQLGGDISFPMISAVNVEVLSYIDAVSPTQVTMTPENASVDQGGVVLKVDKVEYAEKETRVYLTETNNSSAGFNLFSYDMKIVQNGQQIDMDMSSSSSFNGDYPQLSDNLVAGASSSGIVVFPPINTQEPFQLVVEGHSDDMSVGNFGQLTFTFDLPAGEEKAAA